MSLILVHLLLLPLALSNQYKLGVIPSLHQLGWNDTKGPSNEYNDTVPVPGTTNAHVPNIFRDVLKSYDPHLNESVSTTYAAAIAVSVLEDKVGWNSITSNFIDPSVIEPIASLGTGEPFQSESCHPNKKELLKRMLQGRQPHNLMDIVIPTIRDLDFLEKWKPFIANYHLIIIQDGDPSRLLKIPSWANYELYNRNDINRILGEDAWIISQEDASIRNFGFLVSKKKYIYSIDDDCTPAMGLDGQLVDAISEHLLNLLLPSTPYFFNTVYDPYLFCVDFVRGYPYSLRKGVPTVVSHGLWMNAYDYDAPTQILKVHERNTRYVEATLTIPRGILYPLCSMNLAFDRELIGPAIMQGLMGKGQPWGRYDDMFSGWTSKVVADHLHLGSKNGAPYIYHNKASNPFTNLKKEYQGLEWQEILIRHFDRHQFHHDTNTSLLAYKDLALLIKELEHLNPYFGRLSHAMQIWTELWQKFESNTIQPVPSKSSKGPFNVNHGTIPDHKLWAKLFNFTSSTPQAPLFIPFSCPSNLTIFIYDLPEKFNVELVRLAEEKQNKASCNWARMPCAEYERDHMYSWYHQYAAEVPVLAKFLQLPLTTDPLKADLLVVPFFPSTARFAYWEFTFEGQHLQTLYGELFKELVHLDKEEMTQKHVFIQSFDNELDHLLSLAARTGHPYTLTYGPAKSPRDVVIIANDAQFGFPLEESLLPPTNFLFIMANFNINDDRKLWLHALVQVKEAFKNDSNHHIELQEMNDHLGIPLSSTQTYDLMKSSLLCPVLPGDAPYQHRFFDVLAAGCLPLVWARNAKQNEKGCKTYWKNKGTNLYSYACAHDSLPNLVLGDWSEAIVEVPEETIMNGTLTQFLLNLDKVELINRRRNLLKIRRQMIYDWSGLSIDAFSTTLDSICKLMH